MDERIIRYLSQMHFTILINNQITVLFRSVQLIDNKRASRCSDLPLLCTKINFIWL